jgi:two-component system, cell cycle sensor histidine kinase and response regulator CckA
MALRIVWARERGRGEAFRLGDETPHRGSEEAEPAAARMESVEERASRSAAEAPGGSETVLVLEDDPLLRKLVSIALADGGYSVLAEETVAAALAVAERHSGPIHLLLTDVAMPGMSGPEAASKLVTLRPEARVLFMSGYPGGALGHPHPLPPGALLLEKPFSRRVLLQKVREVLDADRAS